MIILGSPDITFGCVELDILGTDVTRIKFNREVCERVSLITYYLVKEEVIGKPLYGTSVWIQQG